MASERFAAALAAQVVAVDGRGGTPKRHEDVVTEVLAPIDGHGHRVRLADEGERVFIRMNSNGSRGASWWPEARAAAEVASERYGTGPGAVRFISGTFGVHVALEARLAAFHGRAAGMLFSSAYATALGVIVALVTPTTAVISDELNHNCIINATKLAAPSTKLVYPHLDMEGLAGALQSAVSAGADRALVVTDGVFSMRGDHAPLADLMNVVKRFERFFSEGVALIVDDSHGVGAFGATGRGTEEVTGAAADVLVGTLGKALGVDGGYVVGPRVLVDLLRETAPTYIYSNPIGPAEAAAALAAVDRLDSPAGRVALTTLRERTAQLRSGLAALGLEMLPGEHPVVALMVRDTGRVRALVARLRRAGVLVTGLGYPVVPRGAEEIRLQVSADHTSLDIDTVLAALA